MKNSSCFWIGKLLIKMSLFMYKMKKMNDFERKGILLFEKYVCVNISK